MMRFSTNPQEEGDAMQWTERYGLLHDHAAFRPSHLDWAFLLLAPILLGLVVLILVQHASSSVLQGSSGMTEMLSTGCVVAAPADLPPVALCP
jgi:hypothetical protein